MTISSEVRTAGPFTGTGAVSTFSFAFKVFQASDLLVVRQLTSTGAQTTLNLTTDYTVSLNVDQDSSPGGNITLVAGALASGNTLVITSDVGNLQPTSLTNQGGFYPEVINDSLDRATIQIQQVAVKSGREVSAPLIDGSVNMTLPSAANRASKFLYFGASGEPMAAAGTNTGNNTSPGNLTLTANNAGSNTARDVIFYDNTTETMRILGSGATSKVGIGTGNPATKLHVVGSSATIETLTVTNSNSTSYFASMIAGLTGVPGAGVPANSVWLEGAPASGGNTYLSSYNNNLAFATGSSRTERMRIDSSGRVGIGMTPTTRALSIFNSTAPVLQLVNSSSGSLSSDGFFFSLDTTNTTIWNAENGYMRFGTNDIERMRILSAGQLLIGSATALNTTNRVSVSYAGGGSEYGMGFRPATSTLTTATTAIIFEQSTGTALGSITHPTTGGTVYNTTSDYRLKTNVTPMSGGLDRIDALKPCNYTWIDSGVASEGFIAHELQSVIPQAVTGTKDEVDDQGNIRAQGVDHSRVVPTLTAAIKELKAIVEAQAARIAALEASA
jgi:hypothetical protein